MVVELNSGALGILADAAQRQCLHFHEGEPPPSPPSLFSRYDAVQGLTFSAEDVLKMTRKTRELLPTIPLSVTVPHTLDLDEQVTKDRAR